MSNSSTITLEVQLDEQKIPANIKWSATQSEAHEPQDARAFLLSIWDPAERNALRIDLWTKKMMVDEMNDFFFQTMMTMADSYSRATNNAAIADDMKKFAKQFYQKANEEMKKNITQP